MRKIILYIATSLDNFIARPDGSIDWLDQATMSENQDYGYHKFYNSIDTTIMGANTYRQVCSFDVPFPYADKKNIVISTQQNHPNAHSSVEFLSTDLNTYIRQLKNSPGKHIWLIGGSQINTYLLRQKLLDELIITRIPVYIGNGIPLFQPNNGEYHTVLNKVKDFGDNVVQLRYSLLL